MHYHLRSQVYVDEARRYQLIDRLSVLLFYSLFFANLLPPRYHGEILSTSLMPKSEVQSETKSQKMKKISEWSQRSAGRFI